jgi:methylamine utilization protein MauE
MVELTLTAKVVIAVLLVAAGGAKLADIDSFAATVRLFWPANFPASARAIAAMIACTEIAAGTASLSSPLAGWVNYAVLGLCCAFVVVSAVGYHSHPGRACRCFGALTGRSFDRAGVARAGLLAIAAALAALPVGPSVLQLGMPGRLGLAAGAALIGWCAYSAAAAIGAGRDVRSNSQPQRGWTR